MPNISRIARSEYGSCTALICVLHWAPNTHLENIKVAGVTSNWDLGVHSDCKQGTLTLQVQYFEVHIHFKTRTSKYLYR